MEKKRSFTFEEGFDIQQAMAEANRCLLCYDAPCSKGCPGGTDPGTFIRKLRMRNITGAIRTIKNNNILGTACGILCPTAQLCEKECSATSIDKPIRIGKIQRFLMEYSWNLDFDFNNEPEAAKQNRAVAIVGSGPAGIACAAALAKMGYPVTVFEARAEAGGVLRYGVPDHRFPVNYLKKELESVEKLGVSFKFNAPISGNGAVEDLLNKGFDAVFIATGLWNPSRLNERNIKGVYSSTGFLSKMKEGKSNELQPDIKGKIVAVIGGGSVAMDCVETSAMLGAKDIYLIYRRSFLQMPAEEDEKLNILNAGTHLLMLNQPVDYIEQNGRVSGIMLRRTELGDADADGRRKPVEVTGSDWELKVDAVVEAIGSGAADADKNMYPNVKVEKNLIQTDALNCATSVAGIFAGGDIVNGPALIIKAIRDGKNAAVAIDHYIKNRRAK